jgi:hypothetical protein
LAVLQHEADEQMVHSQYHHFPSRAEEGADVMVLPARDHDRIGCFTDQVKLTRAFVRDLDEAIKEVKVLREHGEESSQKIMELEALCKKLKEEKVTLEGMVESCDELITKITREIGLDHMGEDVKDEEEDEDANDGGDATAPPAPVPPAAAPEEVVEEEEPIEMVLEQEALVAHEVILVDAEAEMPQPLLYHTLMRDYEESPPRMVDDLDDLDNDPNEGRSDMDEWFHEDGSNDRD